MPGWSLPHNANGRVRRLDCAPAASVATPVRIGEGVTRTFVVAIRGGIELCAVAGVADHRSLRQHRCCDDACEDGCSEELEGRIGSVPFASCMETTRRLSIGYPPPHLDSSGMLKPGLGIHVGCRSTGPLITFIELELR